MHQISDSAAATLRVPSAEFRTARLQRVAATRPTTGRLPSQPGIRAVARRVVLVDLADPQPMPSLALGTMAARLRQRGDEVEVVLPDLSGIASGAWSRQATARQRFIARLRMSGGLLSGVVGLTQRTYGEVASRVSSSVVAQGLAQALARNADAVVLCDGGARTAAALQVACARGIRACDLGAPDAAGILGLDADDEPLVADFTDYPWERTRVLPIEVGALSWQPEAVGHTVREYFRRYGSADFVFVDRALDRDAQAFRAIAAGMQRNAPGAQWIAGFDPSAASLPMTRKEMRAAAAAGLRRATIRFDADQPTAVADLAALAADAGIAVCVRFDGCGANGTPAELASASRFLEANAASIDRALAPLHGAGGGVASFRGQGAAWLAFVDAVHAVNARPARRTAATFDGIL